MRTSAMRTPRRSKKRSHAHLLRDCAVEAGASIVAAHHGETLAVAPRYPESRRIESIPSPRIAATVSCPREICAITGAASF
jgi:hypothetical protein